MIYGSANDVNFPEADIYSNFMLTLSFILMIQGCSCKRSRNYSALNNDLR